MQYAHIGMFWLKFQETHLTVIIIYLSEVVNGVQAAEECGAICVSHILSGVGRCVC